jgi:hypothetical protein
VTERPKQREEAPDSPAPAEESGQLPEEGPPEQVPKQRPGAVREEVLRNSGGADDEGRATGHPTEREER